MIFAEIHRKLGREGSLAHDRSEDALTSTVFGTLRYLPLSDGIVRCLERAREVTFDSDGNLEARRRDGWLNLADAVSCDVQFWPRLGAYGEIDVVLRVFGASKHLLHVVGVEAKYFSQKHNRSGDPETDADDFDEHSASLDPDQLVRYWRGLRSLPDAEEATVSLVYLTAHGLAPLAELGESLERLKGVPGARLAWLSWRDVWSVTRELDYLPAKDVTEYLAVKQLAWFDGFHGAVPALPSYKHLWRARPTYRLDMAVAPAAEVWRGAPGFWRREHVNHAR